MVEKICVVVSNNLLYDSRVRKEAHSLSTLAKEVVVIAKKESSLPEVESLSDKVRVKRIENCFPSFPIRPKRWIPWYNLLRALIKEKARIYHANDPDTLLASYIASKVNRGKLVYDSHELWTSIPKKVSLRERISHLFIRWIERFLAHRAELVLATTPLRSKEMERTYKLKRTPLILLNCPPYKGVKKGKYFDRYKKEGGRIVLYLGGLQPGRGLFKAVEAIRELKGCKLIIMGPVPETYQTFAHKLRDFIKKMKMEDRVIILPPVPPDRVVDIASSADIGIIANQNINKNYFYSLPNKLFEYIQAELPVAVSNFPEMRKIVLKYNIGRVFDPEDPASIKEALQEILQERVYKDCKRNLKKAKRVFNWEREENKLKRAYQGILFSSSESLRLLCASYEEETQATED